MNEENLSEYECVKSKSNSTRSLGRKWRFRKIDIFGFDKILFKKQAFWVFKGWK